MRIWSRSGAALAVRPVRDEFEHRLRAMLDQTNVAGECAGVVADRTGLSVGRSALCGRVWDVERGDEVAERRLVTGQLDDALGDGLFRTDGAGQ